MTAYPPPPPAAPPPPPGYGAPPPVYGAPPPVYGAPAPLYVMAPPPPPANTAKPLIAGIMNIITVAIAFYWTYGFFTAGATLAFIPGAASILVVLGGICALGGILGLLAAIFCFQRKMYTVALVGSIIGMIVGGAFIFGLIATILVATSKGEFK